MYIILADSGGDLMKFVFFGIILFIASIGQILKLLGLDDSKKEGQSKKSVQKRRSGSSEDMENARRRLQEMMRERKGSSLNPSFPEVPKPVLFEEEVIKPKVKAKQAKPKPAPVVMEEPQFDYNSALKESEKLLKDSMIAYPKATKHEDTNPITASEIRDSNIRDLMHDKKVLKKSIIISEILDKPLSLR